VRIFTGLGVKDDSDLAEKIAHSKSFSVMTKGRAPGSSDPKSFYRYGVPGDWRNYFDSESAALFNELAGEWLIRLGYAETSDWRTDKPDTPSELALRRDDFIKLARMTPYVDRQSGHAERIGPGRRFDE